MAVHAPALSVAWGGLAPLTATSDGSFWLRAAADLTAAVHLALVLFVILVVPLVLLGALAGWRFVRSPWLRGAHLALTAIVAGESLWGVVCPLTTWERDLRQAAGQTYTTSDGGVHVASERVGFFGSLVREVLFIGPGPAASDEDWERFDELLQLWYIGYACVAVWTFVVVPPRLRRESDA